MKYTVTDLKGSNEPAAFTNNTIGNYSSEAFLGSFNAQRSPFSNDVVLSQIENFSQTYASKCVNIVDKILDNSLFCTVYFGVSKCEDGAGAKCILIGPKGKKTLLSYTLEFQCTNNTAEYEALIQGLYNAIGLDIKYFQVYGDSKIIIKQVRNTIHCVFGHLKHYQSLAQNLTSHFIAFNISSIPILQNASDDLLANVASKLIPSKEFSPNRFSIDLAFRPSIPDNVTNWRVFNNGDDIINFVTSKGSYEEQIIDEHEHDLKINHKQYTNPIPKSAVNMQYIYDLKDRFKKTTNSKTQSFTLIFEVVNLG